MHSVTQSLSHSLTQSLTHSLTRSPTHSLIAAGLSAVAVAETAIRVDRSPPSLQSYGDGEDIADGDIDYQHRTNRLCVHGTGIIDLESGITEILWQAGAI